MTLSSSAGRRLTGKVVIATHNAGKLVEMRELLAPFGVELVSAGALGLAEPDETGTTFAENAAIKAHAAAQAAGLPALADDSGICADALDGAPGIFSARWGGPSKDFRGAMTRINDELNQRDCGPDAPRRGHFVSALVVAWPNGEQALFEGRVFGDLVWPPRGDRGFGYDPIFRPDGYELTFGEMDADAKHGVDWISVGEGNPGGLSHRARAFVKLAKALLNKP